MGRPADPGRRGRDRELERSEHDHPEARARAALEIVFHEASHILMARGDPVQEAIKDATATLGLSPPRDLWHVVLFYLTGEAVREVVATSGSPGYEPVVYEIMERNPRWRSYRKALESAWRPYMDGTRTLSEAAAELIRMLPEAPATSR